MSAQARTGREFTGRHLLFILLGFFGVIFAVNFTMAYFANSSWTGLVVPNSYIASQEFNGKAADAAAQIARGWTYDLAVSGGRVSFVLRTETGAPVTARAVTVTFKRPVTDREDATVPLALDKSGWTASHALADGAWIAVVDAEIGEDKPWRETLRFTVKGGERS